MTDQSLREQIAAILYSEDCECESPEEIREKWEELCKATEHWGDCNSQSETCMVCLRENYLRRADQILNLVVFE